MDIRYRLATMDDLPAVLALLRAAIREMERNGIHQWDERYYPNEEILREDIERSEMRVGLTNDRIAAIFVLNHDGGEEEYNDAPWQQPDLPFLCIHRLCVHPDFQQKGVAKSALAEMERIAAAQGAKALRLDVFSRNPYACRLYETFGFTFVRAADWRMGRFHLMEKYL